MTREPRASRGYTGALTGTCPGIRLAGQAGAVQKPLGRVKDQPRPIRQGSSEARQLGQLGQLGGQLGQHLVRL